MGGEVGGHDPFRLHLFDLIVSDGLRMNHDRAAVGLAMPLVGLLHRGDQLIRRRIAIGMGDHRYSLGKKTIHILVRLRIGQFRIAPVVGRPPLRRHLIGFGEPGRFSLGRAIQPQLDSADAKMIGIGAGNGKLPVRPPSAAMPGIGHHVQLEQALPRRLAQQLQIGQGRRAFLKGGDAETGVVVLGLFQQTQALRNILCRQQVGIDSMHRGAFQDAIGPLASRNAADRAARWIFRLGGNAGGFQAHGIAGHQMAGDMPGHDGMLPGNLVHIQAVGMTPLGKQ